MSLNKSLVPDPVSYYESQGVRLQGRSEWGTGPCLFHVGSDSFRVNKKSGGYICMNCQERGGDVISFHMALHGMDFVAACKDLGAWVDDGKPAPNKPTPLPARAALEALAHESNLIAVAGGNIAYGTPLSDADRARVLTAANRVANVWEAFK